MVSDFILVSSVPRPSLNHRNDLHAVNAGDRYGVGPPSPTERILHDFKHVANGCSREEEFEEFNADVLTVCKCEGVRNPTGCSVANRQGIVFSERRINFDFPATIRRQIVST